MNLDPQAFEQSWNFAKFKPMGFLPPAVALPLECLPEEIRVPVLAWSEELQTAPDLQFGGILASIAAACQGGVYVRPGGTWTEGVNLYVCALAPPSERKSQTIRLCTAPIYAFEKQKKAGVESENRRRRSEAELVNSQIKEAKAASDREKLASLFDQLDLLSPLSPPCLVMDDTTPEAMVTTMARNGGRVMAAAAEATIFHNLKRYSRDGSSNTDAILKAYSGDRIRVNRVGPEKNPIDIESPSLTVLTYFQPDVASRLNENGAGFHGQGLLARWLWIYPDSRVGTRSVKPVLCPRSVFDDYRSDLNRLCHKFQSKEVFDLRLTPQAVNALRAFAAELEPKLAEGSDLGFMSDWGGKLVGLVLRIAALFHLIQLARKNDFGTDQNTQEDEKTIHPLSEDTLKQAIAIGNYALAHSIRSYHLMGIRPSHTGDRAEQVLWNKLCELAGPDLKVSVRELHRAVDRQRRFQKAHDLRSALDPLVESGHIQIRKKEQRGGRPSDEIILSEDALSYYKGDNGDKTWEMSAPSSFALSPTQGDKRRQMPEAGGQYPLLSPHHPGFVPMPGDRSDTLFSPVPPVSDVEHERAAVARELEHF